MNSTKPVLTMMVGLPGSGKSTYSYQLAKETNATVFSSDELRKEMFGDINDQAHNVEVFNELHKRIKNCLKSGGNAIYDACNISSKRRMAFLQELNKIDCVKECIVIATQFLKCIYYNNKRNRKVPTYAIHRMREQWNTPYWFEGWDKIDVHYCDNIIFENPLTFMLAYASFNQDNSHHTLSLGEHCFKTASYIDKGSHPYAVSSLLSLIIAACIHDCGKPYVKNFKNANGKPTDEAHYYRHENVGAYEALFFDCPVENDGLHSIRANILDVSVLVNLHMQPYYWEREQGHNKERLCNKYRKLWGDTLYDEVMKLHEADKAAH